MIQRMLSAIFGTSESIWGDGFADDDFSTLSSISSWDYIDSDQYLRFYGRLAASEEPLAGVIFNHLSRCVDRLLDNPADASPSQVEFLRDVFCRLREGSIGPAPGDSVCLFAFLTGIHPAYIWSDCFPTYERDTAAGWLGVLASGRPAFMPIEVADYLTDVIEEQNGRTAMRDTALSSLIFGKVDLRELRLRARDRRDGVLRVVRPLPRMGRAPRSAALLPAIPRWRPDEPSIVSDR